MSSSVKSLIDIIQSNLQNLINIVEDINEINNDKKAIFKINNYRKWLEYITESFTEKDKKYYNRDSLLLDYIKENKPHYKGLIKRITELKGDNKFKELDKYCKQYLELTGNEYIFNYTDITSTIENNTNLDSLKKTIEKTKKENIPKQLMEEGDRPQDPIKAAEYDLRKIHDIGKVCAKKLVAEGCTFEILMEEWKQYVNKYGDNLLPYNMPTPPQYTDDQFKSLPEETQYMIQKRVIDSNKSDFKYLSKMHYSQLVGIKNRQHMAHRIPRDELIKCETFMNKVANRVNPELEIKCCGSYRRGQIDSGDLDTLLYHPSIKTKHDIETLFNSSIENNVLMQFVKVLTKIGYITDYLTENGTTKFMAFCKLPNDKYTIPRRIDIKFIPYNSVATALLYFTGSKNLNTMMRNTAIGKHWRLNEYGLYKVIKNKTTKHEELEVIATPTEESVFKALDMKYLKPTERNI